uniref:Uncharacterized protein n=1 Tax=Hyaloperonospora arabidopsidis (strain Emoy2) TaxID=559515 RepID=M4BFF1_HYAAE
MGACFPIVPLSKRLDFVIRRDETLNIGHQLGAWHPDVMRRRIATPVDEVARSLPLHGTVVQDTLHDKALNTMGVHYRLLWRRKYQVRSAYHTLSWRSSSTTASSVRYVMTSIMRVMQVARVRRWYSFFVSIGRKTDQNTRSSSWRTSGELSYTCQAIVSSSRDRVTSDETSDSGP